MWCRRSRGGSGTSPAARNSGRRKSTTSTASEPQTGERQAMADDPNVKKRGGLLGAFRDIVYGMASHEMTRHAVRSRASMEHLFILITMGDLLGVPILPPYYSLRLLPYVTPQIASWKRRMLRERDATDLLG